MANPGGGHLRLAHSNDSTEVLYNKGRGPGGTGGDGGGTSDPMEARVSSLETKIDRIDIKLDGLKVDVSEIKGKLSAMPTTWQMIGICAALIGMFAAGATAVVTLSRFVGP